MILPPQPFHILRGEDGYDRCSLVRMHFATQVLVVQVRVEARIGISCRIITHSLSQKAFCDTTNKKMVYSVAQPCTACRMFISCFSFIAQIECPLAAAAVANALATLSSTFSSTLVAQSQIDRLTKYMHMHVYVPNLFGLRVKPIVCVHYDYEADNSM